MRHRIVTPSGERERMKPTRVYRLTYDEITDDRMASQSSIEHHLGTYLTLAGAKRRASEHSRRWSDDALQWERSGENRIGADVYAIETVTVR